MYFEVGKRISLVVAKNLLVLWHDGTKYAHPLVGGTLVKVIILHELWGIEAINVPTVFAARKRQTSIGRVMTPTVCHSLTATNENLISWNEMSVADLDAALLDSNNHTKWFNCLHP